MPFYSDQRANSNQTSIKPYKWNGRAFNLGPVIYKTGDITTYPLILAQPRGTKPGRRRSSIFSEAPVSNPRSQFPLEPSHIGPPLPRRPYLLLQKRTSEGASLVRSAAPGGVGGDGDGGGGWRATGSSRSSGSDSVTHFSGECDLPPHRDTAGSAGQRTSWRTSTQTGPCRPSGGACVTCRY